MKYPFSKIIIIFNPNSTGDSKSNAKNLQKKLTTELPKRVSVEVVPTKHAGHAFEIAKKHAATKQKVLIVSSSGDGGYNEVVNGVLSLKNHKTTVCVLPSGNANDHYHSISSRDITERIISGETRKIDVLKIEGSVDGKKWSHYAHSYIGAGVTAYVGRKLTEADLNPVNEKWLVLKYLIKFGHISLKVTSWKHEKYYRYSSFVVGNIDRMSKVIKLDKDSSIKDGRFEVYAIRSRSFLSLIRVLVVASVAGKEISDKSKQIKFISKSRLEIQCDGEVFDIDPNTKNVISINKCYMRTI